MAVLAIFSHHVSRLAGNRNDPKWRFMEAALRGSMAAAILIVSLSRCIGGNYPRPFSCFSFLVSFVWVFFSFLLV